MLRLAPAPKGNPTRYLRNHQTIKVSTIDTMIDVVIGKWKLKFSRTIEMSPGNRPQGKRDSHGHSRPAARIRSPRTTRRRCIGFRS